MSWFLAVIGDIREKMKEEQLVIQTNLYGSFELGPAAGPVLGGAGAR